MACKGTCFAGLAVCSLGCLAKPRQAPGADKAAAGASDSDPAQLAVSVRLGGASVSVLLPEVELGCTDTGLRLWVGGLLLSSFLAEHGEELVRGCSVLELGAGVSALPTLVAAQYRPAKCVATDYNEAIVGTARANLRLNGASAASAEILDWEEAIAAAGSGGTVQQWDLVLFADTVYTEEMGTLLSRCIDAVVGPQGQVLGALSEIRVGSAEFVRTMRKIGFVAEEVNVSSSLKASIDNGTVLEHGRFSREELLGLIHGLPSQGSVLVRWRRQRSQDQADDSERIWQYLAGAMAKAESNIRLSDGFEIWE